MAVASPLQRETPFPLRVEVGREARFLEALGKEWRELTDGAPGSPSHTFDYASFAWRAMSGIGAIELAIVAVRRAERLVCIWPLFLRHRGGRTVASHLGCGSNEEYGGPLIRAGEGAEVARAALSAAKGLTDVLYIYNLAPGTALARLLGEDRAWKHRGVVSSPIIGLSGFSDWDAYAKTKSRSFRQGLRYDRKRLEALGDLRSVKSTPLDAAQLVSWLFESKREWLTAQGIGHSWIRGQQGERLFTALLTRSDNLDAHAFALVLNGKTIAGGFCLVSSRMLEYFMNGMDRAFAAYSPGNLLIEDCVRWAIEQGVDFDFRITQDAYKLRWADRSQCYESHVIACTARGVPTVLEERARSVIRAARKAVGPRVKSLLKRFGAVGRRARPP